MPSPHFDASVAVILPPSLQPRCAPPSWGRIASPFQGLGGWSFVFPGRRFHRLRHWRSALGLYGAAPSGRIVALGNSGEFHCGWVFGGGLANSTVGGYLGGGWRIPLREGIWGFWRIPLREGVRMPSLRDCWEIMRHPNSGLTPEARSSRRSAAEKETRTRNATLDSRLEGDHRATSRFESV
ncbi:MAG: hypothetical protein KatS3mg111_0917 [Pirellulaceae bacterium]|nr:MAG: hypothetical protein KatS3mg111_0917 [Pirellulaceae bacterium]